MLKLYNFSFVFVQIFTFVFVGFGGVNQGGSLSGGADVCVQKSLYLSLFMFVFVYIFIRICGFWGRQPGRYSNGR